MFAQAADCGTQKSESGKRGWCRAMWLRLRLPSLTGCPRSSPILMSTSQTGDSHLTLRATNLSVEVYTTPCAADEWRMRSHFFNLLQI